MYNLFTFTNYFAFMRYFTALSILIFSLFSIENIHAYTLNPGQLGTTLNLKHAPATIELNMKKITPRTFKNATLQSSFDSWKYYDSVIRREIINAHKDQSLDTYRVNGLVKKYTTFVDYTNNIFYYLGEIDRNPKLENDLEIQNGLLHNYKMASTYYTDMQYTLGNALKR